MVCICYNMITQNIVPSGYHVYIPYEYGIINPCTCDNRFVIIAGPHSRAVEELEGETTKFPPCLGGGVAKL